MRKHAAVAGAAVLMAACSAVPLTGRHQLKLVPDSTMMSTSFQQYGDFLKENPPSTDKAGTDTVARVGRNIQHAVEQFFASKGQSSALSGYKWEFNLVNSKEVNAWCMPGGKVVVYSAILPVTKDDAGLAVVLGHEIAHAVAGHGNERMSQQMLAQYGGMALDTVMREKPAETRAMWNQVFGVGAQYGALLPFSRLQESEADHLGLIFMAMAGYDPRQAPEFWKRMASLGGQKPPEIMSTHPSDETRIKKINDEMPEALTYYKAKP